MQARMWHFENVGRHAAVALGVVFGLCGRLRHLVAAVAAEEVKSVPSTAPLAGAASSADAGLKAKEGDFIRVNDVVACGLRSRLGDNFLDWDGSLTIYVRKAVTKMWEKMDMHMEADNKRTKALRIWGSPGSGKSLAAWCWLSSWAKHRTAVWIHVDVARIVWATIGDCKYRTREFPITEMDNIKDLVAQVKKERPPDVVVIDGFAARTSNISGDLLSAWNVKEEDPTKEADTKHVKVIMVSSVAYRFDEISDFTLDSWTLEEYCEAVKDDNVWEIATQVCELKGQEQSDAAVDRTEVVVEKHRLAGGA